VRRAAPFDPHFLMRSELLWPLARAARGLHAFDDFPPVEALVNVFDDDPPVRFVAATPRRRSAGIDERSLYDARITLESAVPTRARCWHDLMNALVWGTFPRAKRALHTRQYRAVAERIAPGARTLPPTRTPELDALALLDEGGVIVLSRDCGSGHASGEGDTVVFGHAIYESLVLGVAPAVVAAIALPPSPPGEGRRGTEVVRAIDHALATAIEDEAMLRSPRELMRIRIPAPATTRASRG
jgi:DUF3025 family protein